MNKYYFFFILVFLFFSKNIFAADTSLSIKQQLDRLQREVSDLNESFYSTKKSVSNNGQSQLANSLSSFDLRIYDLEKEIKNLNQMFEDLDFKIDDLKTFYEGLSEKINLALTNNTTNSNNTFSSVDKIDEENVENIKEKNTLGSMTITSNNDVDDQSKILIKNDDNKKKVEDPKIEFQSAYDLLRTGRFNEAKIAFEEFISNNKKDKNILVGSAHYRLGQILFSQENYREAAVILAEGYQGFPESTKAAEMLYLLSESLLKMERKKDACNTLNNIKVKFPEHKIFNQANNKFEKLECNISVE